MKLLLCVSFVLIALLVVLVPTSAQQLIGTPIIVTPISVGEDQGENKVPIKRKIRRYSVGDDAPLVLAIGVPPTREDQDFGDVYRKGKRRPIAMLRGDVSRVLYAAVRVPKPKLRRLGRHPVGDHVPVPEDTPVVTLGFIPAKGGSKVPNRQMNRNPGTRNDRGGDDTVAVTDSAKTLNNASGFGLPIRNGRRNPGDNQGTTPPSLTLPPVTVTPPVVTKPVTPVVPPVKITPVAPVEAKSA